jgi:hypothetical protein
VPPVLDRLSGALRVRLNRHELLRTISLPLRNGSKSGCKVFRFSSRSPFSTSPNISLTLFPHPQTPLSAIVAYPADTNAADFFAPSVMMSEKPLERNHSQNPVSSDSGKRNSVRLVYSIAASRPILVAIMRPTRTQPRGINIC